MAEHSVEDASPVRLARSGAVGGAGRTHPQLLLEFAER